MTGLGLKSHFLDTVGIPLIIIAVLGAVGVPRFLEVRREARAQQELPAALLGKAPPPGGQPVSYFETDAATKGYLAVPKGKGPFPAVLLIHEWDGLNERVRQVADALAAEGYLALAADLYSGRTGKTPEENRALMSEARAHMERVIANLNAAARFLRARPDATGRIAAMGWCMGGGIALSWGLGGERHEGTAIFYGRLVDDPEQLKKLNHEVYGTFGALDRGPSPAEVERFVAALRQAGIRNDVHIYDDVGHGFWLWVDQNPEKRTKPAADAWRRLKAYLDRTLRAARSE
ncbi:MAG: dienelactone hydrolase family protein [Gemmatimonadetes bacterium]|nr:dienelactone hydrolase family protein [Gemmatimonadota bacterium]